MSKHFGKGAAVRWNWGSGTADGKVSERFDRRVQRTIKGQRIVRNGSKNNPAYLIEQADGDRVLKLGSELEGEG
ncbi:hypervirulence associated TUDOR domain-containing protein [Sphingomonas sp. RS6]